MERTEPALVPQWLKCTGNVAGRVASIHPSDLSSPSHNIRSRSFKSNNDKDSPRYLDGTNSRRNSFSNGSSKHPYSSFSRNHRDKNRDRAKEKSLFDDAWGLDSTDPLASILTSRVERSDLRRSHSLGVGARKPVEKLPQKAADFKIIGKGAPSGVGNSSITQKAVFEKDFPSLQTEDKQTVTGIKRVLSPGLTSAVQSLPVGNSGFLSGEKWTSALAEVPTVFAHNENARSPVQQSISTFPNSISGVSSTMAAALSQPAPRLPDRSREELDKKHLRLVPMTPMPKPLVSSSVDKSKQLKVGVRTNEITMAAKVHPHPHSAHLGNQSRFVQTKTDSTSASHVGKFLVLKPGRESISPGVKDASGPTGEADGKVANCQLASPTASKSLIASAVSALENKAAALSVNSKSSVDKRSSQSLAQSRSEFFNLMRRKNATRAPNIHSDLNSTDSSASKGGTHNAASPVLENGNQIIHNGDSYNIPEKTKSSDDVGDDCDNGAVYPDEEEAAFLRSLGWEENGGEEEGLTEEEINAFYQEYTNRRPSELHGSSELKSEAEA